MIYRRFLQLTLIIFSHLAFSQDKDAQNSIEKKQDTIEFIDGKVLTGYLSRANLRGKNGKDKILFCKKLSMKDCEKVPISGIKKITLLPRKNFIEMTNGVRKQKKLPPINQDKLISYHEVILKVKKEKQIPYLVRADYKGKNFNFYTFFYESASIDTEQIFITKVNSNLLKYDITYGFKKKTLKNLTEIFKDCTAFTDEASQKKAHKNHELKYFYKLTDKCDL